MKIPYRELVANNNANSAIVEIIRIFQVEVRPLKNTRGKYNLPDAVSHICQTLRITLHLSQF